MDSNDKKLKILDFGSGSGTNIEMLNHLGNVCVYEKNEEIFNILKLKYEKLKNVKFIEKAPNHIVANFKKQELEIKSSIENIDQIINTIN